MKQKTPDLLQWVLTIVLLVMAGCSKNIDQPENFTNFEFVRSVQVTPDTDYQTGSFARINYVPGSDRFLVTFGAKKKGSQGECLGAGYAYKEYDLEMKETGKNGFFLWTAGACDANDSGSFMSGNDYYFAWVPADLPDFYGWRLLKFNVLSWQILADVFFKLPEERERNNDPMVYFAQGELDISGQYDASETPPDLYTGAATHHTFFSSDLQVQGRRILADVPHVCGSSMCMVDGIRYLISADAFLGDLIVMKYDAQWKYLGMKKLMEKAHWSQGVAFDGERFFVAYLDNSQRTNNGLPVHLNVHLASFDSDWKLILDKAVTDFEPSDLRQPGRPWVILHHDALYVSYDLDTIDPVTGKEELKWQAHVSIFKLN